MLFGIQFPCIAKLLYLTGRFSSEYGWSALRFVIQRKLGYGIPTMFVEFQTASSMEDLMTATRTNGEWLGIMQIGYWLWPGNTTIYNIFGEIYKRFPCWNSRQRFTTVVIYSNEIDFIVIIIAIMEWSGTSLQIYAVFTQLVLLVM